MMEDSRDLAQQATDGGHFDDEPPTVIQPAPPVPVVRTTIQDATVRPARPGEVVTKHGRPMSGQP